MGHITSRTSRAMLTKVGALHGALLVRWRRDPRRDRAMDRAFKRRAEEPNVDCEVLVLITLLRRTKMKHNVTST